MTNPFEVIETRLNSIESLILDLKHNPQKVESIQQTKPLLVVDELAELLSIAKATIYSKYSKGEIPGGCRQGKRLYFDREVIIDWIKAGRRKTNVELEQEVETYLSNYKK